MIALGIQEKEALQAVFPMHCLRATPDPDFISNLYEFDMTLCPHRPWLAKLSHIIQISSEILDPINATTRVFELLVWMQGQVRVVWFSLIDFLDTSTAPSKLEQRPLYASFAVYRHLAAYRIICI